MKWKTRFDDPDLGRITLKFGNWFPNLLGTDAVTIGRTIRCRKASMSVGLYYHERAHVAQAAGRWAVFYLVQYLWLALVHGFRHDKHPMEQDADRKAIEYAAARVPVPLLRWRI